jgi:hypothetical protein
MVKIESQLAIRIEIGLEKAEFEGGLMLLPGPRTRTFQVQRGLNEIPLEIWRPWHSRNKKFLSCLTDGRIRIVNSVSQEVAV